VGRPAKAADTGRNVGAPRYGQASKCQVSRLVGARKTSTPRRVMRPAGRSPAAFALPARDGGPGMRNTLRPPTIRPQESLFSHPAISARTISLGANTPLPRLKNVLPSATGAAMPTKSAVRSPIVSHLPMVARYRRASATLNRRRRRAATLPAARWRNRLGRW